MTAVTPSRFKRLVEEVRDRIVTELNELPENYERAYMASHSQAVRGSAGKITKGGHAAPVEEVVGDPLDKHRPGVQASIRRELERAPKKIANVESTIIGIQENIAKAMDRLDPRATFEALRFPRSASEADLQESREAQQRRRERDEDIG